MTVYISSHDRTAPAGCDPRALQLAWEVHQSERPELTILFGSRVRGDYQDGRSDIDIMLVQEALPREEQRSRTCNMARKSTKSLYGCDVPVQIVWMTCDEFDQMRRTVNHVAANALRDGVVMPRNPENYGSEYDNDHENEWAVTDQRYRHSEDHLQAFHTLVNAGSSDDIIGQQAQAAMEHALKALISANGEQYPHIHDIDQLVERALMADRGFQFVLKLSGSIYNQYAGWQEYQITRNPITHIDNYQDMVDADVRAILNRVQELGQLRPQ